MESLLALLFPTKCLFCRKNIGIFCTSCLSTCWVIDRDYCIVCDKFSIGGLTHPSCQTSTTPASIFSCFAYTGNARECLKISKFGRKQFAALKLLALDGIKHAKACGIDYTDLIVVPIPLSAQRLAARGFNQAELVAQLLATTFSLKMDNHMLYRPKATKYQFTKTRVERLANILGVFSVNTSLARGKKILLVDDLTTTGATLLEASKVLLRAGALQVQCFTLLKREKLYTRHRPI